MIPGLTATRVLLVWLGLQILIPHPVAKYCFKAEKQTESYHDLMKQILPNISLFEVRIHQTSRDYSLDSSLDSPTCFHSIALRVPAPSGQLKAYNRAFFAFLGSTLPRSTILTIQDELAQWTCLVTDGLIFRLTKTIIIWSLCRHSLIGSY